MVLKPFQRTPRQYHNVPAAVLIDIGHVKILRVFWLSVADGALSKALSTVVLKIKNGGSTVLDGNDVDVIVPIDVGAEDGPTHGQSSNPLRCSEIGDALVEHFRPAEPTPNGSRGTRVQRLGNVGAVSGAKTGGIQFEVVR